MRYESAAANDSVELFGGCGGLGLGLARAGFRSRIFVEWNADAVATVRLNAASGVEHIRDWQVVHSDVRTLRWEGFRDQLSLVAGGPPCQPFGIGGLKRGADDRRDMWPEAIRAVRETRPTAFLFENVRNLSGPRFRPYLNWVERRLRHVGDSEPYREETPADQLTRLALTPIAYRTSVTVVNAADFGAPQVRYRILLAGIRGDLNADPGHPKPTHSLEALIWDQWVTGDYWRRHGIKMPDDSAIPQRMRHSVSCLRTQMIPPPSRPWVTLRDATADLGSPDGVNHHLLQPGAKVYTGHTGSMLDMPAKALKAGDHGVPGGENMAILDDGSVRYFTLRESARLVGLPDEYQFCRSWTETMRCLGNAVPTQLSEAAGYWIRRIIEGAGIAKADARKCAA
jgi:DNA (cytosine-5)-methyltransferase 1